MKVGKEERRCRFVRIFGHEAIENEVIIDE
jgi:hypothetical protein